eukprot:5208607-Pleurochrysis_carterae.AAC.2
MDACQQAQTGARAQHSRGSLRCARASMCVAVLIGAKFVAAAARQDAHAQLDRPVALVGARRLPVGCQDPVDAGKSEADHHSQSPSP